MLFEYIFPPEIHNLIFTFLDITESALSVMPLNRYFATLVQTLQVNRLRDDPQQWFNWCARMGNNPLAHMDSSQLSLTEIQDAQLFIHSFVFNSQQQQKWTCDAFNMHQREYLFHMAKRLQIQWFVTPPLFACCLQKPDQWKFTFQIYKSPVRDQWSTWCEYHRPIHFRTNSSNVIIYIIWRSVYTLNRTATAVGRLTA